MSRKVGVFASKSVSPKRRNYAFIALTILFALNLADYVSTVLALRVPGVYETNPYYSVQLVVAKAVVIGSLMVVSLRVKLGLKALAGVLLTAWFFGLSWALMVVNNLLLALG